MIFACVCVWLFPFFPPCGVQLLLAVRGVLSTSQTIAKASMGFENSCSHSSGDSFMQDMGCAGSEETHLAL